MIAIVSSSAPERTAFTTLCDSRGWSSVEHDTVRATIRLLHRAPPRVLLLRHRLSDGYSDDVIAALKAVRHPVATKIIVLAGAGISPAEEARQLALGADCVQRDPIRTEVLLAYLTQYREAPHHPRARRTRRTPASLAFAGANLHPADRTLRHRHKVTSLTPREVALAELLFHSKGEVLSYETLYADILGRKYRGDTGNMRVLLGKLAASTSRLGLELRAWVEVIAKTGYRYREMPAHSNPSRGKTAAVARTRVENARRVTEK